MEIKLDLYVTGNVRQTIKLDDTSVNPNDFVAGLKSGKYATTIGHGDNAGQIIEISTGRCIGKIVEQEALEDVTFTDYELA